MITDVLPLVPTRDLPRATAFYRDVLRLEPVFESDWYVHLQAPGSPTAQLALIVRDHETIPEAVRDAAAGVVVTLETDDVDAVHARAAQHDVTVVVPLRDEPWGQRHFALVDVDGLMVDVVQAIAPDPAFAAAHGLA